MKHRTALIALATIVVFVAVSVLLSRNPQRGRRASSLPGPDQPTAAKSDLRSPSPTNPPASSIDAMQGFCGAINHLIANARPFGLDNPISYSQIKTNWTNRTGRIVYLETDRHLFEFRGNKLAFFTSTWDGIDSRRDPTARSRWYQASAVWTQEEAIQETQSIVQRLGLKVQVVRTEYEPFTLHVNNAAGESVLATPFHTVRLYDTNDSMVIEARFRMGASGQGRLVRWWTNPPP